MVRREFQLATRVFVHSRGPHLHPREIKVGRWVWHTTIYPAYPGQIGQKITQRLS